MLLFRHILDREYFVQIIIKKKEREGNGGHIWPKTPKMALISEYLAADSSPDASADALAIIKYVH